MSNVVVAYVRKRNQSAVGYHFHAPSSRPWFWCSSKYWRLRWPAFLCSKSSFPRGPFRVHLCPGWLGAWGRGNVVKTVREFWIKSSHKFLCSDVRLGTWTIGPVVNQTNARRVLPDSRIRSRPPPNSVDTLLLVLDTATTHPVHVRYAHTCTWTAERMLDTGWWRSKGFVWWGGGTAVLRRPTFLYLSYARALVRVV